MMISGGLCPKKRDVFITLFIVLVVAVIYLATKHTEKHSFVIERFREHYCTDNEDYNIDTNQELDLKITNKRPPPNSMHDKWIVITTINQPTTDIKKLAKIPGWKIVVVGDTKSPKDWKYDNCIFLDIEAQEKLGYKISRLLKYRAYTRKNIGYLYAIEHGAKIIYETDDDNSPTTGVIEFDQQLSKEYLVYKTTNRVAVNPYAHFGQSSIWPRGYPLDMISKKPVHTYERCKNRRALVQQGVVNGDPDVDAIYRLTRKDEGVALDVEFDNKAAPVLLPRGLIAPYNSQNTLHLYDAFWGLLLPQTVAFRVCDIWRGYWTQRLLWDIDGYLSFFGPNAKQFRNSHSYLDDFIDERELYHEASDLVKFLAKWSPKKDSAFFNRIYELSQEMAIKKFWKKDDVLLVQYWLEDLISVGYKPPEVKEGSALCGAKQEEVKPVEKPSSYLRLEKKLEKIFP